MLIYFKESSVDKIKDQLEAQAANVYALKVVFLVFMAGYFYN